MKKTMSKRMCFDYGSIFIFFAAGIALAVSFTISCSSSDDKVDDDTTYSCLRNDAVGRWCYEGITKGACKDLGSSYEWVSRTCPSGWVKCEDPSISYTMYVHPTSTYLCSNYGSSSSNGSQSSSSEIVGYDGEYGTVIDDAGKSYKTVEIGTQTWMAENLNYDIPGSVCGDDDEANCEIYGRQYDWATAMALDPDCNETECSEQIDTFHRGICPEEWHISSNADWDKLLLYIDGADGTESDYQSLRAGKYLKAESGWSKAIFGNSGSNGTNQYGFSALPIVSGSSGGYWWTSTESYSGGAYNKIMDNSNDGVYSGINDKTLLRSVRCVKN